MISLTNGLHVKIKVGTYYVWYKVKGDENHLESEAKYVVVEIIDSNTTAVTIDADGTAYTMTYTNKTVYDTRKHMAYAGDQAPAGDARKAYDLKIIITDQNGVAIDPKIIKVNSKNNKKAGTGQYTVKVKGKQYKALNKHMKSPKYRDSLKFTIEKRTLDSKDLTVKLNKKATKLTKLMIKDSDGFLHKLPKKDYTVVSLDTEDRTAVISGGNNTAGEVTLKLK